MKINEASDYFKSLTTATTNKSELKIYEKFIAILSDLENKDLTEYQFHAIEEELDVLEIQEDTDKRKRTFRRKLSEFKKYLKDNFSLISDGYYTAIGMSMGMCFGIAFGSSIFGAGSGSGIGLSIGMALGLAIGKNMDNKAKSEGRVLNIKMT